MKLQEAFSKYLEEKQAKGALITLTNFRVWCRSQGFKVSDFMTDPSWPEIKAEIDDLTEDSLVQQIARGTRVSFIYNSLLKTHLERQDKVGANKPAVNITVDFKNESENKI